jgi:hypothetical protein
MTRQAYINENELLLLEDGVPAIRAMTAASQGKVRVYLTDGDTVVTHGVKPLKWSLKWSSAVYSALDIAWIDMRMVYLLSEKDMTAFEAWLLNPVPGTRWDSVRRPLPHRGRPIEIREEAARTEVRTEARETRETRAVPNRLVELALLGAEASGAICPITTEPIRASHATMTPCGHIFDRAALAAWVAAVATNPICPECRGPL